MNEKIKWVLKQVMFFIVYFLIITLANNIFGWFEEDSLITNAAAVTLGMIVFELCKLLFKKQSKEIK